MALSEQRKGEIALKILKIKLEDEGINLKPHEVRRTIGNQSKKFGIPEEELAEFMIEMATGVFNLSMEKAKHFVK